MEFVEAITSNNLEAVKSSIEKVKDFKNFKNFKNINDHLYTAICAYGNSQNAEDKKTNLEIIKTLLINGADPSYEFDGFVTSIKYAIKKNYYDIIMLMLKYNIHKFNHNDCIYISVSNGNLKIVKLFLKNGFDINAKDHYKKTPLHSLCFYKKQKKNIKFLLQNGADSSIKDKYGHIPLYYAIHCTILTEELLKYGPDLNEKLYCHDICTTIPRQAIRSGNLELVKLLFNYGFDIGLTDGNNSTLLHVAFYCRAYSIAKFLIENGATVNNLNKYNITELGILMKSKSIVNKKQIINLIVKKGLSIHVNDISKNNKGLLIYYLFPYILKSKSILNRIPEDLINLLSEF